MTLANIFIVIVAFLLLGLNVVATYIVLKTYFLIKARRYYQLLFIWLVPIFGGVIAIAINKEDYFENKKQKDPSGGPHSTYGIINEYRGANHRGGR